MSLVYLNLFLKCNCRQVSQNLNFEINVINWENFPFEAKQSEVKFKSIFSILFTFFHFFRFFSLNFSFTSIFSLNFRLFYLRFRFRFLVFRIEVNHVKSGFFFASKRNEIFASISNFASEAKVRAHPTPEVREGPQG